MYAVDINTRNPKKRMRQYLGYGVLISSDVELLPFLEEADHGRIPLRLERAEAAEDEAPFTRQPWMFEAHGRGVRVFSDAPPQIDGASGRVRFEIDDMLTFSWRAGTGIINYRPSDASALELVPFWFLHMVLPLYLANEGIYEFLHAAAVEADGKAVLFVAPSCGGKSTLASYFVDQGHGLISDDKLATCEHGGQFQVLPAHGFMRPYRAFEVLGRPAAVVARGSKPVSAIFRLQRVPADGQVDIRPIRGVDSFRELMGNYLYRLNVQAAHHMQFLVRLLNATPSYTVDVPEDLGRLEECYTAIVDRLERHQLDGLGGPESGVMAVTC